MFRENPIFKRSLVYQYRFKPNVIRAFDNLGIVFSVIILIFILVLYIININTGNIYLELIKTIQPFSWFIQIMTIIRVNILCAQVIHHDYNNSNWETLKLTNLNPFKYFVAKWQVVIYGTRGWMLALGITRLAIICITSSILIVSISTDAIRSCYKDIMYPPNSDHACDIGKNPDWQNWDKWWLQSELIAISEAIIFSICEILLSSIIGIFFNILLRNNISLLLSITTRFVPTVIFSLWPYYGRGSPIFLALTQPSNSNVWFSLADGGTSAILKTVWGIFSGYETSALAIMTSSAFFILALSWMSFITWVLVRSKISN